MNAYARSAVSYANTLVGSIESPMLVRRRLIDVMERYDNEDAISREIAINAIASGRAAFWTSAKYHNAIACELVNEANRKPLEQATWFIPLHKRDGMEGFLDTLIPLNRLAANELSEAYETLTSSFRDCTELERRRNRRIA